MAILVTNESPCDRCGAAALGQVAEEFLCESCYHSAGSCCGSFGTLESETKIFLL